MYVQLISTEANFACCVKKVIMSGSANNVDIVKQGNETSDKRGKTGTVDPESQETKRKSSGCNAIGSILVCVCDWLLYAFCIITGQFFFRRSRQEEAGITVTMKSKFGIAIACNQND